MSTSRNYIITAIIVLSGLLGWQFSSLAESNRHNCASIKVIAGITRESVQRAANPSTQKLIARISFPGLSHSEFTKLVDQSAARERLNLVKLEKVERGVCG